MGEPAVESESSSAEGAAAPVELEPIAPARRRGPAKPALLLVAVALVVAVGVAVVSTVSRVSAVNAALTSVFSSSNLRVVLTTRVANPSTEATLQSYSVVVAVTSQGATAPLSGSGGVDSFEISLLKSGIDLGDVIVADQGVYVRLDLAAIDPHGYRRILRSIERRTAAGPGSEIARALVRGKWVGIKDSTIESFARSIAPRAMPAAPHVDALRNSFAVSFAQSWDTWASIHQISSAGGTTEYSVEIPERDFVGTFVSDLQRSLARAVPSAADLARVVSGAVSQIPATLRIPVNMWVTGGSLTRLEISYQGSSLEMAISHPPVGVSAPRGAAMVTLGEVHALQRDYGICVGGAAPVISGPPGSLSISGLPATPIGSCVSVAAPSSGSSVMPLSSGSG